MPDALFQPPLIGPGDDDYGRAPINPALLNPLLCVPCGQRSADADNHQAALLRVLGKSVSIADGELPPPSPEQAAALEILKKHDKIVKRLSGKAGTGKSTVIRHLQNLTDITICATTAKAALNVGGVTMDRLFVYNRDKNRCRSEDKLQESMDQCSNIIVLDEASMLGYKMACYVQRVCLMFGKTLILVGDWAQTRPVKDEWITKSTLLHGAIHIFLTECHRQSDKPFLEALNALSSGAKEHPAYSAFTACKVRREPEGDHYVRLYATNALTEAYNRNRLAELPLTHPAAVIKAEAVKHKGDWYPNEEDRLIDDARFMHNVGLKIGARLICTKNEYHMGFVNGDVGTLVDIAFYKLPVNGNILTVTNNLLPSDRPKADANGRKYMCWLSQLPPDVKLDPVSRLDAVLLMHHDRTGLDLEVRHTSREITDTDDTVLQAVRGYPVMLGWAMTVHKAQGATCDHVYVDLSSIMHFPEGGRHGLAYVALSRCRTLEGLKIYGWNPAAIECDPEVWCLLAPPPPPPPTQPGVFNPDAPPIEDYLEESDPRS
jgi:ATP-dependent DNA helicase PIF1